MIETASIQVEASSVKTPLTRLLDMLAGYTEFVSEEELPNSEAEADEIGSLYQEAGALLLHLDAMDAQDEDKAVRQFVSERVLPLLLRRS